jgi:hypothetical protein
LRPACARADPSTDEVIVRAHPRGKRAAPFIDGERASSPGEFARTLKTFRADAFVTFAFGFDNNTKVSRQNLPKNISKII